MAEACSTGNNVPAASTKAAKMPPADSTLVMQSMLPERTPTAGPDTPPRLARRVRHWSARSFAGFSEADRHRPHAEGATDVSEGRVRSRQTRHLSGQLEDTGADDAVDDGG